MDRDGRTQQGVLCVCVVLSFVVGSPDGAVSFSLNAPRPMHLSFLVSSSFVYVTFSSLPTVSSFFPGIRGEGRSWSRGIWRRKDMWQGLVNLAISSPGSLSIIERISSKRKQSLEGNEKQYNPCLSATDNTRATAVVIQTVFESIS